MTYRVLLLPEVADDLEGIFDFIASNDAPKKAVQVIKKIQELIDSLSEFPNRGTRPRELSESEHRTCRELSFKPYRVFYCIDNDAVRVYLVTDGRRNLQDLLKKRLLGN